MDSRIKDFLDEIDRGCKAGPFLEKKKELASQIKKGGEFQKKLNLYKALGNETRFLIYSLLQEDPLCTCALAQIMDLSEGNITHHLKKLEKAGLIFGNKQGRFTVYYTKEKLLELMG
ncbi:MAG: ArsR/SmtB family transcription factor [Promethearchaeota archaeon]